MRQLEARPAELADSPGTSGNGVISTVQKSRLDRPFLTRTTVSPNRCGQHSPNQRLAAIGIASASEPSVQVRTSRLVEAGHSETLPCAPRAAPSSRRSRHTRISHSSAERTSFVSAHPTHHLQRSAYRTVENNSTEKDKETIMSYVICQRLLSSTAVATAPRPASPVFGWCRRCNAAMIGARSLRACAASRSSEQASNQRMQHQSGCSPNQSAIDADVL
jgi:hypothetical protein